MIGFSSGGGTALDLGDIGYTDPGEATFSGTASGGVLTVTDGVHNAEIDLQGDYLSTTFIAAGDGHGGTVVTASSADTPSPHAFVSAMARLGASAAPAIHLGETWRASGSWLSGPRVAAV